MSQQTPQTRAFIRLWTASLDFARRTSLQASTLSPLIWDRHLAKGPLWRVCVHDINYRLLYGVHQTSRVISKQSELQYVGTRTRQLSLNLESIEQHPSGVLGYISMVSTWRIIRSTVFVSALVISVELAQTCVGAARVSWDKNSGHVGPKSSKF